MLWIVCCCAVARSDDTAGSECPPVNSLSTAKVRHAKIVDPWNIFRFGRGSADPAAKAVSALEDKPYNQLQVNEVWKIVEQYRLLPLDLQISYVAIGNCKQREVDLTFLVISFFLSPHITIPNKVDPISAAAPPAPHFRLYPDLGYNPTDKLYTGGTAEFSWNSDGLPVSTLMVKGYGSSSLRWIEAELKKDRDSTKNWLAHAGWAARYVNYLTPTTTKGLNRGRLSANFFGYTRPVKNLVFHFGTVAGAGNDQSGFEQANLAHNVIPSSAYTGLKLYGGFTGQQQRQDFSLAYGLELGGSVNTSLVNDWHKQIGNVQYAFWIPVGDHRQLEIEQQFAGGAVGVNHSAPVGELFFGGNRQTFFVSDQSFQILSNPYIRSLPANSFYNTSRGVGADNFLSYNLTVAATAWRMPLVPSELSVTEKLCQKLKDAYINTLTPHQVIKRDLCKKLNGQFISAANILDAANAVDDARLKEVQRNLPALQSALNDLLSAAQSAQAALPHPGGTLLEDCIAAAQSSLSRVQDAAEGSLGTAYEDLEDLIPGADSPLSQVVSSCQEALMSVSADTASVRKLDPLAANLRNQLDAIDNDASAKASQFMAYVKRLMFSVLSKVNVVSISPVAVFDVARIGPVATQGTYSGTRYGAGPGIRFTLASTVNFTAAYAWNANRHAGEAPGAFHFALTTRNIFR